MSIPSGVALLAELEGLASRKREPKKDIINKMVDEDWIKVKSFLFGESAKYISTHLFMEKLNKLGYTIVRI